MTRQNYKLDDFPPGLMAVPCIPWVWTESARAIAALHACLPDGSQLWMEGMGPSSIAAARNWAARTFFETEDPRLEWLLFIDSDMTPRPDTAVRLLAIAKQTGAGIVSALYFERRELYLPSMIRDGAWLTPSATADLHGVVEVDGVGLGCALIQREVLEAVGDPYFQHPPEEPGSEEDFHFCARARAAGYSIVVDTDFDCGHITPMPLTRQLVQGWYGSEAAQRRFRGDINADTWRDRARRPVRIPEEQLAK